MNNNSFVNTLDFGYVPVRKTHNDGRYEAWIELSDSGFAEIRSDYTTNQPFAVLFDDNMNEIK
jgi:hypothetical protein